MQDINYYMRAWETKKRLLKGEKIEGLPELWEGFVSKKPVVFQVETTNVCNMKCVMCPRTTKMKREAAHMKPETYKKVMDNIEPFKRIDLLNYRKFLSLELAKNDIVNEDEDFFHFGISAESLTMHGFGEPPLDPHIVERVKLAKEKGLKTYFSCNPMNVNEKVLKGLLEAGLDYLKYSIDGLDPKTLAKYRGREVTKEDIYGKIEMALKMIKEGEHGTMLVLTMLGFGGNQDQCKTFMKDWKDKKVFAYVKNCHNRWLFQDDAPENTAHYMRTYCEYPFLCVCLLQDGTVTPCPVDYDGHLAMGNINEQSLEEIWNSKKYKEFRKMHLLGGIPKEHFCMAQCDAPIMGDAINGIRPKG
ncbi:MAG: radical SAM protein [Nanoarchaeota archaeon]|nr:radical SAM protein [Nanoarchaeota archaeon]